MPLLIKMFSFVFVYGIACTHDSQKKMEIITLLIFGLFKSKSAWFLLFQKYSNFWFFIDRIFDFKYSFVGDKKKNLTTWYFGLELLTIS